VTSFRWHDGERVIVFGRGSLAKAEEVLGTGYTLLSTERAAAQAPDVAAAARTVHDVGPGRVDELAGELRSSVRGELLVALGGGRVIDVAKALAAADPPSRVAAIPTTLSGAEMTAIHRHAAGVEADTPRVRPAVVINDPALSASQAVPELAASALNALGHAVEGPLTPLSNPVARLAAFEATRLVAAGFAAREPERDGLALGALLAGYVIGSTGYGLHHVLSQTLVRFAGVGHGPANAIMLPHTASALKRRFPDALAALAGSVDEDLEALAARLCELTGVTALRELGVSEEQLERCADEAAGRPELHMTPPAADRDELRALYESAY
jgi:alcohol dehydrogenase class IV